MCSSDVRWLRNSQHMRMYASAWLAEYLAYQADPDLPLRITADLIVRYVRVGSYATNASTE